jgi:phospholipid/cholesterol/gamma-HCH transport system substrate-binding protein
MKRRNEVLVGIFLTAAIALGVLGTIWLVRGGFRSGYSLYGVFRWGENLRVGQPVRLAGVQIGYVGDVQLGEDGTLLVVMKIEEGRRVPQNARAIVEPVGLFGDAQVALQATPSRTSYEAGDTVAIGSSPPGIPQVTAKADSVATVAVRLSRELQTQMVQGGGIADLRRAIAQTNQLVAQLNTVAAEQSRQLSATQAQLRATMAAVNPAVVDSTLRNFRAASANLEQLSRELEGTSGRVNALLAKVDSGNGNAALLLNDRQLYDNLLRLTTRMDSLVADLKKNPRRYINLEVF